MIFQSPFLLAPMAEITTPALRKTVREFSSDTVLFSEMLSAAALVSGTAWNESWVRKYEFDDPLIYQIMGNSEKVMADACKMLSGYGCYGIDINMGCSAPDILKKGMGAKLLLDMQCSRNIVKACRKAYAGNLSVKMRSGFSENDGDYLVSFVKMLEEEGVDFITLHPRFAKIGFSRSADWKLVKLVKENLKIPVIGNGDISGPADALSRMKDSGCDGVMIGREAVRSPWIFRLCTDLALRKKCELELNIADVCYRTLANIADYLPERLHKSRGHRFCFYYCRNFKFSHHLFK
ncbi:MAG: tRNA-dihydrouridine synthase family protein, partial [Spirochaetes bacterium]|nr:tRNA-dihydrouridine synthase family protein [Spirochaetota bacterium]